MILSERTTMREMFAVLCGLLNSRPPMGHISHVCTDPHCFRGCPRLLERQHWEKRAEALAARLHIILGIEPTEEGSFP